jgi:hypothetical protein
MAKASSKPDTVQVNIRIRTATKARIEAAAIVERRSMADQADVFLAQALDVWEKANKSRKP